jgi:hypothetical protein
MLHPQITTTRQTARTLTISDRLESARTRVRFALCCADSDAPTFDTLDAISRALVAATSDLSHLAADLNTHMNNERKVS